MVQLANLIKISDKIRIFVPCNEACNLLNLYHMADIILGIESSCDDTSAAVIKDGYLLSNVLASQDVHKAYAKGLSKSRACIYGVLSGIVEPVAGLLTIILSSLVISVLPYFLSFAAGAMLFVVVEELVPEMAEGDHSNLGTIMFMLGFVLMMILDVALG